MTSPVESPGLTCGQRLRNLRLRRKLALQAVAVKAPCAVSTLTAIECHDYAPGRILQERLAHFFGVTPEDIWPPDDPDEPITA